jgi:hypothetical protein
VLGRVSILTPDLIVESRTGKVEHGSTIGKLGKENLPAPWRGGRVTFQREAKVLH